MKLSVVVPVYNEEKIIAEFRSRMDGVILDLYKKFKVAKNEVEIIFINDGSTDATFDILKDLCTNNDCYKMVNLSRNYGHQLSITAGICISSGDAVVIIDGDLQDPPEFIIDLYSKFLEGYDVVYAVRKKRRGEGFFKLLTAGIFYRLLSGLTNVNIPVDTGDFRIISRRVADAFSGMKEHHRYVRGMISWIGFRQTGIEYERDARSAGKSKYPLGKMIKFALDGITSFSTIPLKLASYLGFLTAFAGFLYALYVIYLKIWVKSPVTGWSSLMVAFLLMSGIQLLAIGFIGDYIGRINDEVKNRPLYYIEGIYSKSDSEKEEG